MGGFGSGRAPDVKLSAKEFKALTRGCDLETYDGCLTFNARLMEAVATGKLASKRHERILDALKTQRGLLADSKELRELRQQLKAAIEQIKELEASGAATSRARDVGPPPDDEAGPRGSHLQ